MPRELGIHTIHGRYGDYPIAGSPFKCRVYDLTKVKIIKDHLQPGLLEADGIVGGDVVFYGKHCVFHKALFTSNK